MTGDVLQKRHLRILEEFTRGALDILVLPNDCEDYVRHIGLNRSCRRGRLFYQPRLTCEEYALNLTAIESYIGHQIPVSKYNSDALLTYLLAPKRLTCPRTGSGLPAAAARRAITVNVRAKRR